MINIKKIGELNFEGFKTEFRMTNKVENYIKKEGITKAILIPSINEFYKKLLFDHIDKKNRKNFQVIYNGVTEKGNWNKNKGLENQGFKEKLKEEKNVLFYCSTKFINSLKNLKKEFVVNYFVIKK